MPEEQKRYYGTKMPQPMEAGKRVKLWPKIPQATSGRKVLVRERYFKQQKRGKVKDLIPVFRKPPCHKQSGEWLSVLKQPKQEGRSKLIKTIQMNKVENTLLLYE